ncbi:hypothetical protein Ancab_005850 [Ancistrocladus abbreviatus]
MRLSRQASHVPLNPFKISTNSEKPSGSLGSLSKLCLLIFFLVSFSLVLYSAFTNPTFPSPTHWFSVCPECYADAAIHSSSLFPISTTSSCSLNLSGQNIGPTNLSHILFALGASTKTWQQRKQYTDLWWDPNTTRGHVWLDEEPPSNFSFPHPPYRVSGSPAWSRRSGNRKSSDRIARIVKESFELGLPNVRWFVMGDDDTVFFVHNLVRVLSRYDHRQMYYVGGPSESVEQDVRHSYNTAFGGGGYAISYPLACELAKILDGCIERYHDFHGSDEKISACVAEVGVPLTRESGFHQLDINGDPYGLLAAHPTTPLVSLHHLDRVKPLFPNQTQLESLKRLMDVYQLYTSLVSARVLETPLQTFRTWRSWSEGPFVFNTRPLEPDACEQPIVYYLDQVEEAGGNKTLTTYKRVATEPGKKCDRSAYKYVLDIQTITVSALKMGHAEWMKAPRRQCCEITNGRNIKRSVLLDVRSCKPGETATI